ncbi:MAG: hypothetical protein HOH74_28975, partial [Gemmatimonadetes bacterium]|nr:hypothetical protein [Gemmatimonadota bacterium]
MTDEVSSDGHLLDYVYVLVRWRRLIVVGTLLAAVGGAVISVLLPERWTSTTTLLPPEEEPTGLGLSLLAGAGGGIPAGLAGLVGMSTPSERLLTLLESRHLLGLAVDRYELVEAYDVPHRDQAIEILAEQVEHELGRDGSLKIEATAATPQIAADLTTTIGDLLDSLNRTYRRHQAAATRGFLEERSRTTQIALAATAARMRQFQETHDVVDIEAQTQAAVEVVKGLVQELALRQVELGVARRSVSEDHPERQRLQLEVSELEGQLATLVGEATEQIAPSSTALGPPLRKLPELLHEYAQLTLQLRVQEVILGFLAGKL